MMLCISDSCEAASIWMQAFKPGAPVLQNGGKAAPVQITITDNYLLGALDQINDSDFNYACVL